jgi:hypothetical protein
VGGAAGPDSELADRCAILTAAPIVRRAIDEPRAPAADFQVRQRTRDTARDARRGGNWGCFALAREGDSGAFVPCAPPVGRMLRSARRDVKRDPRHRGHRISVVLRGVVCRATAVDRRLIESCLNNGRIFSWPEHAMWHETTRNLRAVGEAASAYACQAGCRSSGTSVLMGPSTPILLVSGAICPPPETGAMRRLEAVGTRGSGVRCRRVPSGTPCRGRFGRSPCAGRSAPASRRLFPIMASRRCMIGRRSRRVWDNTGTGIVR